MVGVQGQVFTIVNDEEHMPSEGFNLMDHAWKDDTHWKDVAKYTGSTTGTTRDNEICSRYTPITWQVDRTCHKVSAKAWDEMCKMMKEQKDDMKDDTHAHGARAFAKKQMVANNQQSQVSAWQASLALSPSRAPAYAARTQRGTHVQYLAPVRTHDAPSAHP